jgi:hypothetical protein
MKLNLLFVINTILAGLFGLGLIFMPAFISDFYGADLSLAGLFMGQMMGACLIGFAILTWLARGLDDFAARRSLAIVFTLGYLIAFVLTLTAQLNGVVNQFGWINVAGYSVLTLAFGYFMVTRQD